MVQWLRLSAFTARAPGSIPGWGTILQAVRHSPPKKEHTGHIVTALTKSLYFKGNPASLAICHPTWVLGW